MKINVEGENLRLSATLYMANFHLDKEEEQFIKNYLLENGSYFYYLRTISKSRNSKNLTLVNMQKGSFQIFNINKSSDEEIKIEKISKEELLNQFADIKVNKVYESFLKTLNELTKIYNIKKF